MRDTTAEFPLDLIKSGLPALILSGIVKKRRDRLVLASAVLEDKPEEPGDARSAYRRAVADAR